MSAQTVFALGSGMFVPSRGIPMPDEGHELPELPRTDLPAPQLVMLANVALTSEGAPGDCVVEEKQMVELKNVGCSSYSDSEDENVIRYSYDNSDSPPSPYLEGDAPSQAEPGPAAEPVVERVEDTREETRPEDLSKPPSSSPPAEGTTPVKRKHSQAVAPVPATAAEPPKKKKKPFYCKPCQYQAACEEEFIRHIRVHSTKKMIVINGAADSDDEAASGGPAQQQGAENGAAGACTKGVIRCERCGYNTNRYDHYMAHLRHHKNEGDDQRVFRCTICPYSTVSQYHWKKHLRNHFPSKLFTCNQCFYFSDRKNNYIQHIRTHTGERPFQCLYCDYSSSQKTHLTRHMRTHSGERPFKCDSCSYLAANQHEVTRHARQVHNGPKPLSCPYCQYKTADRSNFKKHVELHVNPRQFLCPVCKYAASKKCNLQYHIKSRHPGCSDISMDVSKVRLRVKKADGEEVATSPGGKQGEEAEQQDDGETTEGDSCSGPMNLSVRKSGKTGRRSAELPGREKSGKASEKRAEKRAGQKSEGRKVRGRAAEKADPVETPATPCTDKTHAKRDKDLKKAEKATKSAEKVRRSRSKKEKAAKVNVQEEEEEAAKDQNAAEVERGADSEGGRESGQQRRREDAEERKERGRTGRENGPRGEKEDGEREAENTKDAGPKKAAASRKAGKKPAKAAKGEQKESSMSRGETFREAKAVKRKAEDTDSPHGASARHDRRPEKVRRKAEKASERPSTSATVAEPAKSKGSKGKARPSRRGTSKAETTVPEPEIPSESVDVSRADGTPDASQRDAMPPSGPEQVPETLIAHQALEKPSPQCTEKCTAQKPTLPQQEEEPALLARPADGAPMDLSSVEEGPGSTTKDPQITETLQRTSEELAAGEEQQSGSTEENIRAEDQCKGSGKAQEAPEVDSGNEEIPSPTEHESDPGFRQEPAAKSSSLELPGPTRRKPADAEDDEGIHSHDGGSDISDCASEGSYDSGLNGLAATAEGSEKLPSTPTEELPSPTQLLSHTCVFCDRTFPLEMDYRRHLHRHLVNVYYLETAMQKDK
ncbi:RE1-silencing transcription factor [Brachyhypopomus gauderio]|uniref:RE1-silencing transcription factor n=1 Tax=Brachyhypopomus gauderio TaxID=698409 RepID=UPI004041652D